MLWILFLVVGIAAVLIWNSYDECEISRENERKLFENHYTEDIDFSLAAKGYPVVNDMDIRYTNYLARNPDKINL